MEGKFEKKISYSKDIVGQVMGKNKRNINKLKARYSGVKIINKSNGKENSNNDGPYFILYGSSVEELNKCVNDLEKQIINARDTVYNMNIQKRVDRELQRAKRKAEVERNIRDKIIKELAEQDKVKDTKSAKNIDLSKDDIVKCIRSTNPFSALMDAEDEEDESDYQSENDDIEQDTINA